MRYAGASGDFNPIHYRDDVAASVGLPGVLAHGMLTMGIASSVVVAALEPGTRILDYGVRFTKPVVVDPDDGADLHVLATVGAVDDDVCSHRPEGHVRRDDRARQGAAARRRLMGVV